MTPLLTIISGRLVLLNVPSPNWPESLLPMAHRLPSVLINKLCPPRRLTGASVGPSAAIAVMLLATINSGRLVLRTNVPSPNWPYWLSPMAHRLPSLSPLDDQRPFFTHGFVTDSTRHRSEERRVGKECRSRWS